MNTEECLAVTGDTVDQIIRQLVLELHGSVSGMPERARDEIMIGVACGLVETVAYDGRAELSAELRGELIEVAAGMHALQLKLAA